MVKPSSGFEPLLRRPFSIFEVLRDGGGTPSGITLLNKRWASRRRSCSTAMPGSASPASGRSAARSRSCDRGTEAWMVAGGVGLAPFATLADALALRGVRMTLFYGGRSADDLFYLELFE